MSRSRSGVELLHIEKPSRPHSNKGPLKPTHLSPTRITRNPNIPVVTDDGSDGGMDVEEPKVTKAMEGSSMASKGLKLNEAITKSTHEARSDSSRQGDFHHNKRSSPDRCSSKHKELPEFDEEKQVYKTPHNTFEIIVKLKKPKGHSSSTGEGDMKVHPVVELVDGNKVNQKKKCKTKLKRKERIVGTGSWADVLTKGRKIRQNDQPPPEIESESEPEEEKEPPPVEQPPRKKNPLDHANKSKHEHSTPLKNTLNKQEDRENDQQLIIRQLQEENELQKGEILALVNQLDKAQIELKEYTETIKELYDLATVLKNENTALLESKEQQAYQEQLAKALTENDLLKKHLLQLTQQHDQIIKPKEDELKKLKNIVNDVKSTLADEIIELQQMQSQPVTNTSSSSTAAAKCSSSSFFRNINLTDEEHDELDERRQSASSNGTSISEIRTIYDDDDDDYSIPIHSTTTKSSHRHKNDNLNKRKQSKEKTNRQHHQDDNKNQQPNEEDSNSTQYLYLLTNERKNKDYEDDQDDLDGLKW